MNIYAGIARKIPQKQEQPPKLDINKRNILEVNINNKNEFFEDGKTIQLKNLKQTVIDFIDNGGGLGIYKKPCD